MGFLDKLLQSMGGGHHGSSRSGHGSGHGGGRGDGYGYPPPHQRRRIRRRLAAGQHVLRVLLTMFQGRAFVPNAASL